MGSALTGPLSTNEMLLDRVWSGPTSTQRLSAITIHHPIIQYCRTTSKSWKSISSSWALGSSTSLTVSSAASQIKCSYSPIKITTHHAKGLGSLEQKTKWWVWFLVFETRQHEVLCLERLIALLWPELKKGPFVCFCWCAPRLAPARHPPPFLTSPPLQQQLKSRACLSKVQAITTHGDSFAASTEQTEVRKNM